MDFDGNEIVRFSKTMNILKLKLLVIIYFLLRKMVLYIK